MRIGTWDVQSVGAKQWRVDYGTLDITSSSDWVPGAKAPVFFSSKLKPKKITVTIQIKGTDKRDIKNKISEIVSHCQNPVEYYLDKDDHIYYGIMNRSAQEQKTDKWFNLKLELTCVEYGTLITSKVSGTKLVINNPGNIESPVKITIVPSSAGEVLIEGINGVKKIKNATQGAAYVIDGMKGLFKKNAANAFGEMEISAMPSIPPGDITITLSRAANITMEYNPYYM